MTGFYCVKCLSELNGLETPRHPFSKEVCPVCGNVIQAAADFLTEGERVERERNAHE